MAATDEKYIVDRWEYKRGKQLSKGEKSLALYGLVGTKKDVMLRVEVQQKLAEFQTECSSRHLEEVFLVRPLEKT
jgi:hypothetical protein